MIGAILDLVEPAGWIAYRKLSPSGSQHTFFGSCSIYGSESTIDRFRTTHQIIEDTDSAVWERICSTNFTIVEAIPAGAYKRVANKRFSLMDSIEDLDSKDLMAFWVNCLFLAEEIDSWGVLDRLWRRPEPSKSVDAALDWFEKHEYSGLLWERLESYREKHLTNRRRQ